MNCPETPTLKRKSSHKRIIISSPSQDLLRFLNLPNPSANQDPRQRLHIVTPKSNHRSLSKSDKHIKPQENLKLKPSPQSRINLIRKKGLNQFFGKKDLEVRQSKLTLSSSYKSKASESEEMGHSLVIGGACRLDFTFGFERNQTWLKV